MRKIPNSKLSFGKLRMVSEVEPQISNSKHKGFTLLELLITSAIIIIIASVGTVNFLGYRNKNRLNLAGDEIGSLLRTIQNRAISGEEQSSWGVYFKNDATNGQYYYEVFYGNSYPGTIVSRQSLDGSLKFVKPEDNTATTTIFRELTGSLTNSSPVNIIVSLRGSGSASTTINVYKNGRVEY